MCRYRVASLACHVAADRAEYTARLTSQIAGRIEDPKSQTVAEAAALIDEWVLTREGLQTAEEIMTLVANNAEAFETWRQQVNQHDCLPAAAPRRTVTHTRPAGSPILSAIQHVRGNRSVNSL